uniref:Uncharacterized protein n=1 Tax=Scleropages formosus TaxID=113540 RepID=A0A8C9RFU5_SCLFO
MKTMEEPPYLTVGTDVSAKYRGAFCEAKIKTAKRLVKAKVTFKLDSSTAEVHDEHIRGVLKVGLMHILPLANYTTVSFISCRKKCITMDVKPFSSIPFIIYSPCFLGTGRSCCGGEEPRWKLPGSHHQQVNGCQFVYSW